MDRTTLNIVPALRLVLVGGLFAVFWIIFGAGSAHAAAPPPGERPHTADGLVTSLTAPVKPLIAAVQPRTEPAPQSPTAPAPAQGPASAGRPVAATLVRQPPAPVTQLVAGTVQPLLAPVTNLADTIVAPVTAPVTQLVAGTVQPLLAPVTNALDSSTQAVTGLITGPTLAPVSIGPISGGIPGGAPPVTAASPAAPVTANTSLGGADRSTTVEFRPAAVSSAKPGASTTVLSHLPTAIADGIAARGAASMDDGGASPQSPSPLSSGHVPATAPVPSPVSGSAGASGPTGAGAQAAADLSYRFVLPLTGGGDGSLFSFVLPGSTTQDPGFSPD
ncbi:hypothetical protein ACFFGR_01920 [Arthrobacter liuii]|uniref:Uncharacterized protein n=1 Tax=Arthrobacter liuii TaxID=1476996 RepID=A0ABQ2B1G6_9MICC|nr:hypothetical protein [Arthrobacter liuii]GGI01876.1 hypothetical protein GCM10007170_42320 [Arthrobacter liuii]